ncbi:MAG: HigA family addiction module antidote protein [Marichromatium sp.]|nr:HigA family addiction module antidote protein [Marichromatium sp.]
MRTALQEHAHAAPVAQGVNPAHPGAILRTEMIEAQHLTVADVARRAGLPRTSLSRLTNCRGPMNAEIALRLERAGFGAARVWMTMQALYDLAQARKELDAEPPKPREAREDAPVVTKRTRSRP